MSTASVTTEEKGVVIFDTSFFRSLYDNHYTDVFEIVANIMSRIGFEYIVLKTVLEEYDSARVVIRKYFKITDDHTLDISKLQALNIKARNRSFEKGEIGDYKFIQVALNELDKGKNPIIVTNDEGIRNFVYKVLRIGDRVSISFVSGFLKALSYHAITKEERDRLLEAAKESEKSYLKYRKKTGRNKLVKSGLEIMLSTLGKKDTDPDIQKLNEAIQKYFKENELDKNLFPNSYHLFYDAINEIRTFIDTGRLKEAMNRLEALVSETKETFQESIHAKLSVIVNTIILDTFYKLAIELDNRGFWWESLGLLQSIKSFYILRPEKPPKNHLLLLDVCGHLIGGTSGIDEPIITYKELIDILSRFDLSFLHELQATAKMLGNEELENDIEKIILNKTGLEITNKMKRSLKKQEIKKITSLDIETPFTDVMVINKVVYKESFVDVFVRSNVGMICLRIPSNEEKSNEELKPGKIMSVLSGKLDDIKAPPPQEKNKWKATFIFSDNVNIETSIPRGVVSLAEEITQRISEET